MKKVVQYKSRLREQGAPAAGNLETDNAPSSDQGSSFTPAEQKFLGKFDARGTNHLGILYSPSEIGIQEFLSRTGKDLNCTPEILAKLRQDGIIDIVPYSGFGRNTDYTIELKLSLDDIKGMGAEDEAAAEAAPAASGAPTDSGTESSTPPPPPPGPPTEWIMGYGDLLTESSLITYKVLSEKTDKSEIYTKQSRILKDLPRTFIVHLNNIIDTFSKKKRTVSEKQKLIADILDNLMINFDLDVKQITKSYDMHRNQKKLKKILNDK
jgi:hypothetical protein